MFFCVRSCIQRFMHSKTCLTQGVKRHIPTTAPIHRLQADRCSTTRRSTGSCSPGMFHIFFLRLLLHLIIIITSGNSWIHLHFILVFPFTSSSTTSVVFPFGVNKVHLIQSAGKDLVSSHLCAGTFNRDPPTGRDRCKYRTQTSLQRPSILHSRLQMTRSQT